MNILEALERVRQGAVIMLALESDIYFILQSTVEPFGVKKLVQVDLLDIEDAEKRPVTLSDISYNDLLRVNIDCVTSDKFQEVNLESMLERCQVEWDNHNT